MNRGFGYNRPRRTPRRWAPETPAGITFKKYGENVKTSYSYGGYIVLYNGEEIGKLERRYPTWQRKPKGLRYVTARGTSSKPEWRIDAPDLPVHGHENPYRAYLVEDLLKAWKNRGKKQEERV